MPAVNHPGEHPDPPGSEKDPPCLSLQTWLYLRKKHFQDRSRHVQTSADWGTAEPSLIRYRATSSHASTPPSRSEEHTSELQSRGHLVCRLLLEKKKKQK